MKLTNLVDSDTILKSIKVVRKDNYDSEEKLEERIKKIEKFNGEICDRISKEKGSLSDSNVITIENDEAVCRFSNSSKNKQYK